MSEEPGRDATPARALVLREEAEPPRLGDFLRAAPGLARVAVNAGLIGAARTAEAYAGTVSRAAHSVARGEPTGKVVQELTAELRAYARDLLDLPDAAAPPRGAGAARPRRRTGEEASREALRDRGSELLRRSADVRFEEASHPAYMRILESLAPDEGRILRFLAQQGPQPAVDVRTGLPLVSELVAPGCSMIAAEAGCRHAAFTRPYMDNLHRLGLIWFSREPVKDPRRYQVLEVQPEVVEALHRGGRLSRTVRRSILLTPFGEDFCAVCLPPEELEVIEPV
jgi:Abortive infection alpha